MICHTREMTIYGNLREEGGDNKECCRMTQHIIMTGAAGRTSTHVDIRGTFQKVTLFTKPVKEEIELQNHIYRIPHEISYFST